MNPTDTPLLVLDGLAAIVKSPGGTMTSAAGAITRLTGSSSAAPQVLNVGAGLVYGNVEINKATATDRVTLSSNVADANIIGNLTVNTGILNTGGYGIVGAGSTFEVKAGAIFELVGTSGIPASASGYIVLFQPGSQTIFAGANQIIGVTSSGSYGDLILVNDGTPGAIKSLGGTIQVAGTLTIRANTTLSTANSSYLINDLGTAVGKTKRGSLTMEAGAELRILNATTIAQPGLTGAYSLAPTSTVRFMGGTDQIINTRINQNATIVTPTTDVDVLQPLPYANLVIQGSGIRDFTYPGDVLIGAGSTLQLVSGNASTVARLAGSLLTGAGGLTMSVGEI